MRKKQYGGRDSGEIGNSREPKSKGRQRRRDRK